MSNIYEELSCLSNIIHNNTYNSSFIIYNRDFHGLKASSILGLEINKLIREIIYNEEFSLEENISILVKSFKDFYKKELKNV